MLKPAAWRAAIFATWFKQKIGSIGDFKGLKIRASQAYVSHIKSHGGTPVIMKPSEMYIGLERGIVDGLGWPRMGLRDYALQEVTKYILNVPFFTVANADPDEH